MKKEDRAAWMILLTTNGPKYHPIVHIDDSGDEPNITLGEGQYERPNDKENCFFEIGPATGHNGL